MTMMLSLLLAAALTGLCALAWRSSGRAPIRAQACDRDAILASMVSPLEPARVPDARIHLRAGNR